MRIQFINGYRGILTNEIHYLPGTVMDLDRETALELIREGRAVAYDPDPEPIEATDAAVELAAEHGIDLAKVAGSGAEGRILVSDVKAAINA